MQGRNESISEDSFELLILKVCRLYLNFVIDIFGLSDIHVHCTCSSRPVLALLTLQCCFPL